MTFNLQNWARASVSANEPLAVQTLNGVTVAQPGCFRTYNYFGVNYTAGVISGDTQAEMAVTGYFNTVAYDLQINDSITCFSAIELNYRQFRVIAISPDVVLAPLGLTTETLLLTAANIIAMNGAPIQLLEAPGAGDAYQISSWSVNMRPVAGPVAFTGGTNVVLQYDATAAGAGAQAAAPIPGTSITGGTTSRSGMGGPAVAFGVASTVINNAPIYISNTGTAFAAGNGNVAISVTYKLMQVI